MESGHFSCRGSIVFAWIVSIAAWAPAQVLYRGEVNRDQEFDSGDVVSVYNALVNPTTTPGLARLLADANGDYKMDELDVVYTSDILLGTALPLPLVEKQHASPVSLLFLEGTPEIREENTSQASLASLYFVPPVPNTTEDNTLQVAAVSLYYTPLIPPTTDENTVPIPPASFYYVPTDPSPTENNTGEAGTPSFYYQALAPLANKNNTVQQGTPSFDRQ